MSDPVGQKFLDFVGIGWFAPMPDASTGCPR